MLTLFFQLYIHPFQAMSRLMDEGSFLTALALAAGVSLLLPVPLFTLLATIAFVFVPSAILALNLMDSLGGAGVILRRDYMAVLICMLMAWAAAFLPISLLHLAYLPAEFELPLAIAGGLYFLFLGASAVRTVMGATIPRALAAMTLAVAASVAGNAAAYYSRGALYYLASPLFLYYGYSYFQGEIGLLGTSLRSRQNFRRNLEAAAVNPHDADAQYQLGLIYQRRHQLGEAESRFRKAIAIDKEEPDAHHQLGRLLSASGKFEEALPLLERASALDEKLAQSEVWRDLGSTQFSLNRLAEAEASLGKYTERRPYDPEGLFWHGKTLAALGHANEARAAYERTMEAVNTTPRNRIGRVRQWGSKARAELKKHTVRSEPRP